VGVLLGGFAALWWSLDLCRDSVQWVQRVSENHTKLLELHEKYGEYLLKLSESIKLMAGKPKIDVNVKTQEPMGG